MPLWVWRKSINGVQQRRISLVEMWERQVHRSSLKDYLSLNIWSTIILLLSLFYIVIIFNSTHCTGTDWCSANHGLDNSLDRQGKSIHYQAILQWVDQILNPEEYTGPLWSQIYQLDPDIATVLFCIHLCPIRWQNQNR